jgi:hypothetical protein
LKEGRVDIKGRKGEISNRRNGGREAINNSRNERTKGGVEERNE